MFSADRFGDGGQRGAFAVFRRAVLAHAMHGDVGAEAREALGKRAAKATARAGDESDFAGEGAGGGGGHGSSPVARME
jgi:hypothetical protein